MELESNSKEKLALIGQEEKKKSKRWTKQDYILFIMGMLISFGDGIELYLPGNYHSLNSLCSIVAVLCLDNTFPFDICFVVPLLPLAYTYRHISKLLDLRP